MFWLLHQSVIAPSLTFSLGLPIPETNNINIRPINNLTMTSKCSSEEKKSPTSLTLNQKVEMIKLSEEGML